MTTKYTKESNVGLSSLAKDDLIELVQIMGDELIGDYGSKTAVEFGNNKEMLDSDEAF